MAKGIVVVDMPADCRDCPLRSLADDCIAGRNVMEYRHDKRKPDWCPIKTMLKSEIEPLGENSYLAGWNDCISYFEDN